jgi:hypothetical protein
VSLYGDLAGILALPSNAKQPSGRGAGGLQVSLVGGDLLLGSRDCQGRNNDLEPNIVQKSRSAYERTAWPCSRRSRRRYKG